MLVYCKTPRVSGEIATVWNASVSMYTDTVHMNRRGIHGCPLKETIDENKNGKSKYVFRS
jgi:hypothetical protein